MSKQPSAATVAALDPGATAGVGSPLEFVEYEAENGATNGRIVGPDRTFTTLASKASGRRAVLLEGRGDYVEFTLSAPANALTVRYALPDGREAFSNAIAAASRSGLECARLLSRPTPRGSGE